MLQPALRADHFSFPSADELFAQLVEAVLAHDVRLPQRLATLLDLYPHHARGWATKAILTTMLGRAEVASTVSEAACKARQYLGSDPVDANYVQAAEHLAEGQWQEAIDALEQALQHNSTDSLAAKLSHALRFMLGDAVGMLASIERVMRQGGMQHPHVGYLLGCQAFALEENHRYGEAERIGRRALDHAPRDAWGMHAVSHVHEMTGRAQEGLEWIGTHPETFRHCNNFRFHLLWHQALFHLDLGDSGAALDGYDHFVRADKTDDFRDIANGASLLKRLELSGTDVGDRWEELADIATRRINDRTLVFADLHYVLALAGAGQNEGAKTLATSMRTQPAQTHHQSALAADAGMLVAEGILAHTEGRYAEAATRLHAARARLQRIGGSHAQRDVFEQIMLDAMVRAGDPRARPLLLARLSERGGHNAFASALLSRQALASPA